MEFEIGIEDLAAMIDRIMNSKDKHKHAFALCVFSDLTKDDAASAAGMVSNVNRRTALELLQALVDEMKSEEKE